MPFRLVYYTKVVSPIEIAIPSHRIEHFDREANEIERWLDLDLADEKRWRLKETQALIRFAATRYYNRKVSALQFFMG